MGLFGPKGEKLPDAIASQQFRRGAQKAWGTIRVRKPYGVAGRNAWRIERLVATRNGPQRRFEVVSADWILKHFPHVDAQ